MRSARRVMSSRLPMGVPTMYRQPPPGADPFDGERGVRAAEPRVGRFLDMDRSLAPLGSACAARGILFDSAREKRRVSVPLYEYKCLKCGRKTEKIENVDGPHLKKCPHCGGKVEALFSAPAIQFKGSGWYVTDYGGKKSSGDSGKEEKAATDSKESKESKESANDSGGKESAAKDSGSKDSGSKDSGSKEKKAEKSARKK